MEKEKDSMFDLEDKKETQEVIVGLEVEDFQKKKWEYEFDINQKVGAFLESVLKDLGISNDKGLIKFAFKDKILNNDKTLISYGIGSLDTLCLIKEEIENKIGIMSLGTNEQHSSNDSKGIITVSVYNTNNEKQEFLIKEDSTVDELIEMYQGTINFDNHQEKQKPQKKQLYVQYNGKILEPDMTLKKCELTNLSVVHIIGRVQGGK